MRIYTKRCRERGKGKGETGLVRERIQIQIQRERERRGSVSKKEFSVFVLNLPRLLDKYGLFGIFQRAGRVCDTYIPIQSNRKATRRFGFVRFTSVEDASRCIKLFHGAIVRGYKLIVAKAKPKRQNQQGSQGQQRTQSDQGCKTPRERLEWRPKVKDSTKRERIAVFSDEGKATGFSITGDVNKDNEEWLRRSLVGTVEEPRDLASLSSALLCDFDPCVKLSALSSFQFLLTFPTVDRMEEVLIQKDALYYWFFDVKRWGVEDYCGSRRIWLNIVGVPPQGWMWENFKKIAEIWGRFICLGKQATATDSFEAMKVCIATNILQKINSEVVLSLGSCGYRITVT